MIAKEVLEQATKRLVENFHPEKIILFGSQARGSADERSDADILVICELSGSRRLAMTAMDRALRGLRFARDIVVLTPSEYERDRLIPGTIARPAWREGKVLYERRSR